MNKKGVRSRFDRVAVHPEMPEPAPDAVTQQQFRDECDMNRIVLNAMRGIAPRFTTDPSQLRYGDFSDVPDMCSALNRINDARDSFMKLPARLRLELNNDFRNIDQLTHEQARYYGLLKEAPADLPLDDAPVPAEPKAKRPKAGQAAAAGTEPADPT